MCLLFMVCVYEWNVEYIAVPEWIRYVNDIIMTKKKKKHSVYVLLKIFVSIPI